jgi:hypothetical protein
VISTTNHYCRILGFLDPNVDSRQAKKLELYRQSDCRLSAKLVTTSVDRGVSHGTHNESLWPYSRFS